MKPPVGRCDEHDNEAGRARSNPPGDGDLHAGLCPDPDFALLEGYLDGELSPADISALDGRLRREPELAGALARLSAEFAVRQAVWQSLEPDSAEAMAVAGRTIGGARRADLRRRMTRLSRFVGAAAACAAVGFLAGWVGRGTAVAQAGPDVRPLVTRPAGATAGKAEGTSAGKVGQKNEEPYIYQVALTDDAGNITAVQKFDNLDEARSFAADVWRSRQPAGQPDRPAVKSSGL